jgi:hypothetical protein
MASHFALYGHIQLFGENFKSGTANFYRQTALDKMFFLILG